MLEKTANGKLSEFLDRFGGALAAREIDAVTELFQNDCYWRDLVTFTWNIKTLEGKDDIRDMLESQLDATKPFGWAIAAGERCARGHPAVRPRDAEASLDPCPAEPA